MYYPMRETPIWKSYGYITNINKEVIFHKMVFESLNLGPSASNSACGSTAKKVSIEPAAICDCVPESRVRPRKHAFCVQYRHCEV